jgi:hypothetical protein
MSQAKQFLLEVGANWADEMNLYSLAVIDENEANLINHEAIEWPMRYWFGTNEDGYIDRDDLAIKDIPKKIDACTLKELLNTAGVDKIASRVLDNLREDLYETQSAAFEQAYKTEFLALEIKAIAGMEDAAIAMTYADEMKDRWNKRKNSCPRKTLLSCSCSTCERQRELSVAAYNDANEKWLLFEKESGLAQVPGREEFGYPSGTWSIVAAAMEENEL